MTLGNVGALDLDYYFFTVNFGKLVVRTLDFNAYFS